MLAPERLRNDQAHEFAVSSGVSLSTPLSVACRKEITRCIGNENYTPRWRKSKVSCFIKDCTDIFYASLHKSSEAILQGIQKGGLLASTTEIPIPNLLCKCHYHIVYNITGLT